MSPDALAGKRIADALNDIRNAEKNDDFCERSKGYPPGSFGHVPEHRRRETREWLERACAELAAAVRGEPPTATSEVTT